MSHPDSSSYNTSEGLPLDVLRALAQNRDELTRRLFGIYRDQGQQEGYQKAVNELIMALVQSTEEYLDQHPEEENLRSILYGFVEHLDLRIRKLSLDAGYMENGLGI
jgi:hypothetical protein